MSPASDTQQLLVSSPVIKVNGSPLDLAWQNSLVQLRVNLGLSMMGRATLRFVDPGYALATAKVFELGTAVEIGIAIGVDKKSVFKGFVTGTSLEQSMTEIQELVVTADDAAYKFNLAHRIASYEQVTVPDVISKLASLNGLSADVATDTTTHDYLLQRGSDMAFLESLTRRINCVWYMDDTKLVVKQAGGAEGTPIKLEVEENLIDFSVRTSALRPQQVQVNGWDSAQLQAVVGTDGNPDIGTEATFAAGYKKAAKLPNASQSKIVVAESNPNTAGEAGALAKSLQTMWRSEAITARGTTDANPALKPYTKITIEGNGPVNGDYLVNEVEHIYTLRGFFTKFVAGPVRPKMLVDSLSVTPPDPGFAYQGLVTAIVSDIGSDSDHIGMVKVKFPSWDNDLVSAWARVVSFGAGTSRGAVFLPEVNDEVLVGFERGDTRHPVVLGGLFGKKTTIAADNNAVQNGAVDYRRITSRTGHVIELGDGEQDTKSHIKLALGKTGYEVRLGADRFDVKMPAQKPFAITVGNASIEIDAQGNISIKGMKITLDAEQDITVGSKMDVNVKGQIGLKLEGGVTAELKGQATTTVEASGQTAVKGGVVMIN